MGDYEVTLVRSGKWMVSSDGMPLARFLHEKDAWIFIKAHKGGIMKLYEIDVGVVYYVAARSEKEALSLLKNVDPWDDWYGPWYDPPEAIEVGPDRLSVLKFHHPDGTIGPMEDEFKKATNPSIVACSEF